MRTIHLDAVGGIAGDMFVAAMLDAFPELRARVLADSEAVLPRDAGAIFVEEGAADGIRALRFGVRTKARSAQATLSIREPRDGHERGASPEPLETYRRLVQRIETASLKPGTADHAIGILTILAETEGRIHGVGLDEVHFHEIADWDSLVDVVAAGSIAAALDGSTWTISPLPRGGGLVRTQHGLLPVPAPATACILKGFEWRDDGVPGERVTPTGAAIARYLTKAARLGASGRLMSVGTGAGTRVLPGIPNVLRALVFEWSDDDVPGSIPSDSVGVIEFEVDDMTGEEIGAAVDRLRTEPGVLDVAFGHLFGKKGRPVLSFRLLAEPTASTAVARRCFSETSTIGLRIREDRRLVLSRETASVDGIPVKTVARPGGRTAKAENDSIAADSLAERRALKRKAEQQSE